MFVAQVENVKKALDATKLSFQTTFEGPVSNAYSTIYRPEEAGEKLAPTLEQDCAMQAASNSLFDKLRLSWGVMREFDRLLREDPFPCRCFG